MAYPNNTAESSIVFYQEVIFPFERDFNTSRALEWMNQHRHEAFYYAGFYILLIFSLQEFMKHRPRLELRRTYTVWNSSLAVFSITALCRGIPPTAHALKKFGFTHLVCFIEEEDPVSLSWAWLFVFSKVMELGDTVFIVLRKQRLQFLHWYHHITVLLFTWYSYSEFTPVARWFVLMNLFAHSLMYTYYTLRALGVAVPTRFAIVVTTVQLSQMLIGCCISYISYIERRDGRFCHCPDYLITSGMALYFSYLVLFARYFYRRYFIPKRKIAKSD